MASVKKLKASHIRLTYSVVFCCFKSTCKEECLQTDWSGAPGAQWLYTSHTAPLTSVELHKLLVNEAILKWNEEWGKGAVDLKDKVRRFFVSPKFSIRKPHLDAVAKSETWFQRQYTRSCNRQVNGFIGPLSVKSPVFLNAPEQSELRSCCHDGFLHSCSFVVRRRAEALDGDMKTSVSVQGAEILQDAARPHSLYIYNWLQQ